MKAVDLFAGLGGFSEGARLAGVNVAWAANHWPAEVEAHRLNHPETDHACQDLQQADWSEIPRHDLLMASPACQGHSRARGVDRPHHDACRSTAWAVVACAEYHRPAFVVVENVPEFLKWTLFPAWENAMTRLGYAVAAHILDAADHGVPQHRRRVFVVCARGRKAMALSFAPRRHVAAETILDSGGAWSAVADKCANTRARIEAGRRAHGSRFLIAYYGNEKGGRSTRRPSARWSRLSWSRKHSTRNKFLFVNLFKESVLPESLRRVLAAKKPQQTVARTDAPAEVTTIWRDGEVWRQTRNGGVSRRTSVEAILT